jgi:hypothetical protein
VRRSALNPKSSNRKTSLSKDGNTEILVKQIAGQLPGVYKLFEVVVTK